MLGKLNTYCLKNGLFTENDSILLTVSGGKDSMTMLHLFIESGKKIGVAHCNFRLRGDESDKDEVFVKDFCEKLDIPFFSARFDTLQYMQEHQVSTQMAARELRYEWFEKVRLENNYQHIATAHHKNDVAETMLINLTKGTGIAGLHGIRNRYNYIIRPMLCFDRAEIDSYVEEQKVLYREDQSNSSTKYTRNAIRHNVIPELEKINPSLITALNETALLFSELESILKDKVEQEKTRCCSDSDGGIKIDISALCELDPIKTYLYYFIKEFGFNFSDVQDIVQGLMNQSGKTYYSTTHQLVKDRQFLILKKNKDDLFKPLEIRSVGDFPFTVEQVDVAANFNINTSKNYAYLDADKVQFPLIVRGWKPGDVFKPLGMEGTKKVSDYLIDIKMSILDKKKLQILSMNDQIIWLVGHRIDDRFKITPKTKRALILSVNDQL